MNMRGWLSDLLSASVKKPMPILSFPSISLLGVTVNELISDPALQAEGMRRVAERVPSAASVSMMDLSVEAEAFGCKVRFSDDEVPTVVGMLVDGPEAADALAVPAVGAGRTGRYVEAIGMAKKLITDRPVFAGIIGPFSLAGRLMDVTEAMVNILIEPEMVHTLLRKATDFQIEYAKQYKAAGADGVVIAEPLAGLLSPDLEKEFSAPYVKEIADSVKGDGFAVIYHNCGNNTPLMVESILSTGCDAYHFGNAIEMSAMLSKMPSNVLVMGNVDPAGVLRNGTPEQVRERTLSLMRENCVKHPNFVISTGCDIPPATPWENIDAFFAAAEEYYAE